MVIGKNDRYYNSELVICRRKMECRKETTTQITK